MVNGEEGKKVLMAVAWTTDMQSVMFVRFPEVVAADTTAQTNQEKRPLFLLAALTADNKTFSALSALLPSLGRWVFDWLFRYAIPTLLPTEALARVNLLLTDGDEKEFGSFIELIEQHYPNAMHGLCIWHLLDRGMIDKKITAGSLSDKGKLLFKVLTQWMYSWSSSVESNAEFSVSYELFIRWIKPDEVASELTRSFVTNILNFLTQNVLPLRKKWVRDEKRARCRGFGKRGTSFAEAENSVLKTHPLGTRPHHSAKRAVRTIARLDQVRLC